MSWEDQVAGLHAACLNTFGISALWTPKDKIQALSITGVKRTPGIEEESRDATVHVRFWVDSVALMGSYGTSPAIGDAIQIDAVNYHVRSIEADIEGGAVLKLRRNC